MKQSILHPTLFLLVFALCSSSLFAQNHKVRLESIETGEPLAFRKLTYMPSGNFTATDDKGLAELDPHQLSQSTGIMVSGFALNDTILIPEAFTIQSTIKLRLKDTILAAFSVEAQRLNVLTIGNESFSTLEAQVAAKLVDTYEKAGPRLLDMKYGAWVKLPKEMERYVSKLNFHVGGILEGEEWVDIRILGNTAEKRLVPYRIYSLEHFFDLADQPLNIKVDRSGWHEVEFESPIPLPKNLEYILVIFDLLKESKTTQQVPKSQIQKAYYSPPGKVWIENNPNKTHPAITLELLTH